jgi:hypothetical protein
MGTYNAYDVIYEGYKVTDISDVKDFVRGFVFSECEISENEIRHAREIEEIEGIVIHYDYGADYYFFTDSDNQGADHVSN